MCSVNVYGDGAKSLGEMTGTHRSGRRARSGGMTGCIDMNVLVNVNGDVEK